MSKSGAENQKPGANTDRGQMEQRATQSAARAAKMWQKSRGNAFRGRTGTAAPVLWARVCPLAPLSPGAYRYPWGSPLTRYAEFRVVFISIL